MNNMDIWDKVERTDPRHAKRFDTGKLKGTSPNATFNMKRATEIFGPAGEGWRVEVVDDRLESLNAGGEYEHTTHVMSVDLHWKLGDRKGVVRGYGQTPVVYPGRERAVVDYDYAKKSYTDAVSNALKQLGFSADIWLGKYDDNRYIAEVREQFANMDKGPAREPAGYDPETGEVHEEPPPREQVRSMLKASVLNERLKQAKSVEELNRLWKENAMAEDCPYSEDNLSKLSHTFARRKHELKLEAEKAEKELA